MTHRWRRVVTLLGVLALVLPVATPAGPVAAAPREDKLVRDMTLAGVLRHLTVFQGFANLGDGRRASSTLGHDLSVAYVATLMRLAGYRVTVQEFPFTYTEETKESLQEVSPLPRTVEVDVMSFSPATGDGGITAALAAVPADADPGCTAADFAGGSYVGKIALIQRGSCTFAIKQANAAAAGAIATIVYNNDTTNPNATVNGSLGAPGAGVIPTAGISLNAGLDFVSRLAGGPAVVVTLDVAELVEARTTRNVIAETKKGRTDKVVMLGSHLDSVPAGPGINDNGTGSAALIELALQFRKTNPKNQVRFAWWGAEEFGLVGSTFYVNSLTAEQQANIAMYLNFDMIGSPNYMRGIYDGDDSDAVGAGPGPTGSAEIEKSFEAFFAGRGLVFEGTDFSGRSDYGPFIAVGIPAGGLFTGADGIKTAAQVARYGGTAGIQLDPCYHQACDTLANLDHPVLEANADAIAAVLSKYQRSVAELPARTAPAVARVSADTHHHDDVS